MEFESSLTLHLRRVECRDIYTIRKEDDNFPFLNIHINDFSIKTPPLRGAASDLNFELELNNGLFLPTFKLKNLAIDVFDESNKTGATLIGSVSVPIGDIVHDIGQEIEWETPIFDKWQKTTGTIKMRLMWIDDSALQREKMILSTELEQTKLLTALVVSEKCELSRELDEMSCMSKDVAERHEFENQDLRSQLREKIDTLSASENLRAMLMVENNILKETIESLAHTNGVSNFQNDVLQYSVGHQSYSIYQNLRPGERGLVTLRSELEGKGQLAMSTLQDGDEEDKVLLSSLSTVASVSIESSVLSIVSETESQADRRSPLAQDQTATGSLSADANNIIGRSYYDDYLRLRDETAELTKNLHQCEKNLATSRVSNDQLRLKYQAMSSSNMELISDLQKQVSAVQQALVLVTCNRDALARQLESMGVFAHVEIVNGDHIQLTASGLPLPLPLAPSSHSLLTSVTNTTAENSSQLESSQVPTFTELLMDGEVQTKLIDVLPSSCESVVAHVDELHDRISALEKDLRLSESTVQSLLSTAVAESEAFNITISELRSNISSLTDQLTQQAWDSTASEEILRSQLAETSATIAANAMDLSHHEVKWKEKIDAVLERAKAAEAAQCVLSEELLAHEARANARLVAAQEDLQQLRAELGECKLKQLHYKEMASVLSADRDTLQTQLVAEQMKLESHKQHLSDTQAELNSHKQQLSDTQAELNSHKQQLTDTQAELESHKQQLSETQAELESHKQQLSDTQAELDSHKQQLSETQAELESHNQQLSDTQAELESHNQQLSDTQAELESHNQQLSDTQAELESHKQQLSDTQACFSLLQSEHEIMKADIVKHKEQILVGSHRQMIESTARCQALEVELKAAYVELTSSRENSCEEKNMLDMEIADLKYQLALVESEREALSATVIGTQVRWQLVVTELEDAKATAADLNMQLVDIDEDRNTYRYDALLLTSQLSTTESQLEVAQTQLIQATEHALKLQTALSAVQKVLVVQHTDHSLLQEVLAAERSSCLALESELESTRAEVLVITVQLRVLEDSIQEVRVELSNERKSNLALVSKLESEQAAILAFEESVVALQSQLSDRSQQLQLEQSRHQELNQDMKSLEFSLIESNEVLKLERTKIYELERQLKDSDRVAAAACTECQCVAAELASMTMEHTSLQSEYADIQCTVEEAKASALLSQQEKQAAEQELRRAQADLLSLRVEFDDCNSSCSSLQDKYEAAVDQLASWKSSAATTEEIMATLKLTLQTTERQLENADTKIETLESHKSEELTEMERKLAQAKQDYASLQSSYKHALQDLATAQSQLESLNIRESEFIAKVLELESKNSGLKDTVGAQSSHIATITEAHTYILQEREIQLRESQEVSRALLADLEHLKQLHDETSQALALSSERESQLDSKIECLCKELELEQRGHSVANAARDDLTRALQGLQSEKELLEINMRGELKAHEEAIHRLQEQIQSLTVSRQADQAHTAAATAAQELAEEDSRRTRAVYTAMMSSRDAALLQVQSLERKQMFAAAVVAAAETGAAVRKDSVTRFTRSSEVEHARSDVLGHAGLTSDVGSTDMADKYSTRLSGNNIVDGGGGKNNFQLPVHEGRRGDVFSESERAAQRRDSYLNHVISSSSPPIGMSYPSKSSGTRATYPAQATGHNDNITQEDSHRRNGDSERLFSFPGGPGGTVSVHHSSPQGSTPLVRPRAGSAPARRTGSGRELLDRDSTAVSAVASSGSSHGQRSPWAGTERRQYDVGSHVSSTTPPPLSMSRGSTPQVDIHEDGQDDCQEETREDTIRLDVQHNKLRGTGSEYLTPPGRQELAASTTRQLSSSKSPHSNRISHSHSHSGRKVHKAVVGVKSSTISTSASPSPSGWMHIFEETTRLLQCKSPPHLVAPDSQ